MTGGLGKDLLDLHAQACQSFPHVGSTIREIGPHTGARRNHAAISAASNQFKTAWSALAPIQWTTA